MKAAFYSKRSWYAFPPFQLASVPSRVSPSHFKSTKTTRATSSPTPKLNFTFYSTSFSVHSWAQAACETCHPAATEASREPLTWERTKHRVAPVYGHVHNGAPRRGASSSFLSSSKQRHPWKSGSAPPTSTTPAPETNRSLFPSLPPSFPTPYNKVPVPPGRNDPRDGARRVRDGSDMNADEREETHYTTTTHEEGKEAETSSTQNRRRDEKCGFQMAT